MPGLNISYQSYNNSFQLSITLSKRHLRAQQHSTKFSMMISRKVKKKMQAKVTKQMNLKNIFK